MTEKWFGALRTCTSGFENSAKRSQAILARVPSKAAALKADNLEFDDNCSTTSNP
jgi:hypothetical protein